MLIIRRFGRYQIDTISGVLLTGMTPGKLYEFLKEYPDFIGGPAVIVRTDHEDLRFVYQHHFSEVLEVPSQLLEEP